MFSVTLHNKAISRRFLNPAYFRGIFFHLFIKAQPIEPTPKSKPRIFFVAMVYLCVCVSLLLNYVELLTVGCFIQLSNVPCTLSVLAMMGLLVLGCEL